MKAIFFRNEIIEKWMLPKLCQSKYLMTLVYCLISPILVLVEEVLMAKETYQISDRAGNVIDKLNKSAKEEKKKKPDYIWEKLTEEERSVMVKYYNFKEKSIDFRSQAMSRESSIQLVYQTAFVFYQFFLIPVRELDFSSRFKLIFRTASSVWIMQLVLQIISILLSAYSTFSPILENLRFKRLKKHKKEPHFGYLVVKIIQVTSYIFFSSGVVYL